MRASHSGRSSMTAGNWFSPFTPHRAGYGLTEQQGGPVTVHPWQAGGLNSLNQLQTRASVPALHSPRRGLG